MAFRPRPKVAVWLAVASLAAAPAAAAATGLGEAKIRDFIAQQQRRWNDGALEAYFATFAPRAVFTDQYRTPAGEIVPYGDSTLPQARVQARKFRTTSKVSETGVILRIVLGADGRTAQVVSREVSRVQGPKGLRVACAERRQDLVLTANGLRSKGQTDTFSRCPAAHGSRRGITTAPERELTGPY
jgi:hypothetical protein